MGLKPDVPRPILPLTANPEAPGPTRPPFWQRLYRATWWEWFWIEDRQEDRVTWRKHWVQLARRIWLPLLALILWGGILILLHRMGPTPGWFLIGIGGLLIPVLWLWWNWDNWRNDLYTVTDDRLIGSVHSARTDRGKGRIAKRLV